METTERLYRSKTDKVIGGVAGGLADYFNIDVVLARVVFVLLALFGGSGVLVYIIMWIIVPGQNGNLAFVPNQNYEGTNTKVNEDEVNTGSNPDNNTRRNTRSSNTGLIAGIVLIFLGMLFLADRLLPWHNITDFWPLLLVFIGVLIIKPDIFKPSKKQSNEI